MRWRGVRCTLTISCFLSRSSVSLCPVVSPAAFAMAPRGSRALFIGCLSALFKRLYCSCSLGMCLLTCVPVRCCTLPGYCYNISGRTRLRSPPVKALYAGPTAV